MSEILFDNELLEWTHKFTREWIIVQLVINYFSNIWSLSLVLWRKCYWCEAVFEIQISALVMSKTLFFCDVREFEIVFSVVYEKIIIFKLIPRRTASSSATLMCITSLLVQPTSIIHSMLIKLVWFALSCFSIYKSQRWMNIFRLLVLVNWLEDDTRDKSIALFQHSKHLLSKAVKYFDANPDNRLIVNFDLITALRNAYIQSEKGALLATVAHSFPTTDNSTRTTKLDGVGRSIQSLISSIRGNVQSPILPDLMPVPFKPLLFDLALDDIRIPVAPTAQHAPVENKEEGLLKGLVRNLWWSRKWIRSTVITTWVLSVLPANGLLTLLFRLQVGKQFSCRMWTFSNISFN